MQDLHLIGVHEDGEHLLLVDDSGAEFRLRLDDAVRQAARREPRIESLPPREAPPLGPREVQAMIRAGATAEEAAVRAGWTVEKVHRYDGPILAEREHIATTAGRARLRGRYGDHGATLAERVDERLSARGVPAESVTWDSWRTEDGQWTVVVAFLAGGRARQASWAFSRQTVTVQALDDEALWLSGDDGIDRVPTTQPLPVAPSQVRSRPPEDEGQPLSDEDHEVDPPESEEHFDLADSVRNQSAARHRRGGFTRRTHRVEVAPASTDASPTSVPPVEDPAGPEGSALTPIDYDPDVMGLPPGAHSDPDPDGADGLPEPVAAEAAKQATKPVRRHTKVAAPRTRRGSTTRSPVAVQDLGGVSAGAEAAGALSAPSGRASRRRRTAHEESAPVAVEPESSAAEDRAEPETRASRRASRTRAKGRASVPSWDDVMFGSKSKD
ncbi:septation protein SepH [Austwickia chelonae]|uniref:septation protein SepH n=1 Tax=Austwickia chelonae TaxID=100225 RepID=UPI000E23EB18|nr:septation protein SepH [Austwickia chelonae]